LWHVIFSKFLLFLYWAATLLALQPSLWHVIFSKFFLFLYWAADPPEK
jgi:hypothetical protein